MQNAAENGRHKELYNIIKQLTKRNNRQTTAVQSKDGELLKNKEARMARWKEHFEEVLNRNTPESPPRDEDEEVDELEISEEPPSIQEIRATLRMLKNGKAPGEDQITAEMLKADSDQTSKELKHTFDHIWKEEKLPKEWTKGLICKIPKKGNLQECSNWRGGDLTANCQ